MLHFIIGGAGCGKSHMITELIKKAATDKRDVLALVPEQYSYEFDRNLYDRIGPKDFNSIETHSFTSLARDIFRRFGGSDSGSYMDELMQNALVLKALDMAKGQLEFFGKQTVHGELANEAASLIALLRRSQINSEKFLLNCMNFSGRLFDKASDIAKIYQYYEMLLSKHNLKDNLTDITEAAAIANASDFFAGKVVFIDEFESFTHDQYEMLNVIIGLADEVYIALRMESETENKYSLFASVGKACGKLKNIALQYHIDTEFILCKKQHRMKYSCLQRLSETLFRPNRNSDTIKSEHIHIYEAASPDEETEYVCASIKRMLEQNRQLKCRDIAVVTNDLASYAGMLEHSMKRYGIPFHIDMPKQLIHTPFMVYLTSLAELLTKNAPDTELLLRCGKTGFTDLSITELSELENYCYIWSIDGSMWHIPFTMDKENVQCESLRLRMLAPLKRLKKLCSSCETGSDYSKAVYEFLSEQNIGEKAACLFSCQNEGKQMQMKQDFKRIWESLIDILDVLAFLYDEEKCSASKYFFHLNSLLKTISHSVPPKTLDAVFIGPAGTSRLSCPKVTFVLNVCDGSFPKNASGNAIFSERERIELANQGIEIGQSPELNAADERLAVYKILSSASDELYLCYPLKDSGDKKAMRSSIIDHALSLFSNSKEILLTENNVGTAYFAVSKAAAYYHYVRDFSKKDSDIAAIQTILYEDTYYAERIDYLKNIHDDRNFTVNAEIMEKLVGSRLLLSSSQIETYNLCPFQYFCKYALSLFERRKVKLEPLERGNLIHACLEELIKNTPRDAFLNMTESELGSALQTISEKHRKEFFGGELYQSERDAASFLHITEKLSSLAIRLQEEFMQSEFYPEFIEAVISDNSTDFPSPLFLTSSGHPVSIRGKVDRIDVFRNADENWVRVIDYKTGAKKFSLGYLAYGLDMQMLLYLFAITGKRSILEGSSPAGVLYMPAGSPECTLERGSEKSVHDAITEQYKMNGILINDKKIIGAMDKNISGKFVGASLLKDGNSLSKRSGIFLNSEQFEKLKSYTEKKLVETADNIYSGKTNAEPLILGKRDSCAFCTFQNLCGNAGNERCRKPELSLADLDKQVMDEIS